MWRCPSCQLPLELYERQWLCDNKHTYDVAKEGYVNLLLAQHKRSKDPGDNKDMINARRAFLDAGHYEPLARRLSEIVSEHANSESLTLFDAGCGEGYYLNAVSCALSDRGIDLSAFGCDVSKVAIQKAAKRYKSAQFAVASTFKVPIQSTCVDAVIQVFAPSSDTEMNRLLKAGGIWITVDPAPEHLHELKALVYDQQAKHDDTSESKIGFVQISHETLSFACELATPQERLALLKMTPFYWTATEEKRQQIEANLTSVTTDFSIRVYKKQEQV